MSGVLEIVVISVSAKMSAGVKSGCLLWFYPVESPPLLCAVVGPERGARQNGPQETSIGVEVV